MTVVQILTCFSSCCLFLFRDGIRTAHSYSYWTFYGSPFSGSLVDYRHNAIPSLS